MSIRGYAPGWQLRCRKCGFTRQAADAGIIRIRAYGKKLIVRRCPQCGQTGFHALEMANDPIGLHHEKRLQKLIIILLLFLALFPPSLFFGIRYGLSKALVYQQAVERTTQHPQVIQELGQPLNCKMWSGSIYNGHAGIHFKINGSKTSGIVYIIADKENRKWNYQKFLIVLENDNEISLLGD